MVDSETLRENVNEVLKTADLTKITTKKVREQIEEKLGVNLSDRKKEIDGIVMEVLNQKKEQSSESEGEEARPTPGKRGRQESSEDEPPQKKPGRKAKGAGKTGYLKSYKLSPELAAVMGTDTMARHEVVKQVWKLVKEKNLYDPKNKQFAICNDELLPVFGIKRFRIFGMMKYLKDHFVAE